VHADLIVTDNSGARRAAIEVKGGSGTSALWARDLRANLLQASRLPVADYFVIVTPEEMYLWPQEAPPGAEPTVVAIGDSLKRYLKSTQLAPHTIGPQSLEILVGWWLRDVSRGVAIEGLPSEFIEALRWGNVSLEPELDS
jgi:hypothetical protein